MDTLKFTKMHGLGNDYVYVDCLTGPTPSNPAELSRRISPRHTAIGSDGLILILPSETADFAMRIFNADGSEAQMCGNGSRCVGKYVYDHGLTTARQITLETLSGVKHLTLHPGKDGKIATVTVDMGEPVFDTEKIPVNASDHKEVNIRNLRLTALSMGNPHGVLFLNHAPTDEEVTKAGPGLERDQVWPERANIEFVHPLNRKEIEMRVWERGSGETMACGTGACASAVASMLHGLTDRKVTVHLRGGDLTIEWDKATNHVLMTGPATEVFTGQISE